MCKLQLLNTNYNLLTKFNIEKSSSIHLANFLTWYEVETYTKNAPLKKFSRGKILFMVLIITIPKEEGNYSFPQAVVLLKKNLGGLFIRF